jgi:hypothetical protein
VLPHQFQLELLRFQTRELSEHLELHGTKVSILPTVLVTLFQLATEILLVRLEPPVLMVSLIMSTPITQLLVSLILSASVPEMNAAQAENQTLGSSWLALSQEFQETSAPFLT